MSALCQNRTHAPQQTAALFDDLVGAADALLHHKHPGGAPQMVFGKSFGSTRKLKTGSRRFTKFDKRG
jgi:hypothetical protein